MSIGLIIILAAGGGLAFGTRVLRPRRLRPNEHLTLGGLFLAMRSLNDAPGA
jgi:uncharacterized membrane protein SpoIIM required for sporulation